MAVSPDALLIFSAREEEDDKKEKKLGGKKQEEEKMLPPEESRKMLGIFAPKKEPEAIPEKLAAMDKIEESKMKIQENVQAIQVKQEEQQTAQQQAQQQPQQQVQQPQQPAQQPVKAAQEEKPKPSIPLLKYDIFRKGIGEPKYVERKKENVVANPNESTLDLYANNRYISVKGPKGSERSLSKEAASGQKCIWHPWRQAYAICKYCHLAYCFEDIVEYNKSYYCLEDIDKVSISYKKKMEATSTNFMWITGFVMIIAAFGFFYFSNAQLLYIFNAISSKGFENFFRQLTPSYEFALAEGLAMLFAFVSALMVLGKMNKGYYIALFVCLGSVALFAYQFTSTGTFYLGIIGVLMFLSFVALIYSRTTRSTEQKLLTPREVIESNVLEWPNAGKF